MALIAETKGKKWTKFVEELIAKGFKKRTGRILEMRWRTYLNVDNSAIRDEEKQLIIELYKSKLSFA